MTNMGIKLALYGAHKADLFDTLNEMFAFEQACGIDRPGQTFYRYDVPQEQLPAFNRFRLIVKRDGLVCLSRLGREIVRAH